MRGRGTCASAARMAGSQSHAGRPRVASSRAARCAPARPVRSECDARRVREGGGQCRGSPSQWNLSQWNLSQWNPSQWNPSQGNPSQGIRVRNPSQGIRVRESESWRGPGGRNATQAGEGAAHCGRSGDGGLGWDPSTRIREVASSADAESGRPQSWPGPATDEANQRIRRRPGPFALPPSSSSVCLFLSVSVCLSPFPSLSVRVTSAGVPPHLRPSAVQAAW